MTEESAVYDPYEALLADLRAKRAQIDQVIGALEAIRSWGTLPSAYNALTSPPAEVPSSVEGPGWLLGLTIPDAAKKLLAGRRQPMRNPDIVEAFKAGGLAMNSKDPVNTVGSVLTRRFNEVGDIVKIGRGTWGLKEWYPGRSFKKEKGENGETKTETASAKPAAA